MKHESFRDIIVLTFAIMLLMSKGVETTQIILIGDSRFCGLGYFVLGASYAYHDQYYSTGTNIRGAASKEFGGYNYLITVQVGASYIQFSSSNYDVYSSMHSQLINAGSETKVILWLGVNNLDASNTVNLYAGLAKKYNKLKFFAISVTGVSSKCSNVSNDSIRKFNDKMKSKIASLGLSNLKYKSILSSENPTLIYNSKTKTKYTIDNSTTDAYGIHYTTAGYTFILNAMLSVVG